MLERLLWHKFFYIDAAAPILYIVLDDWIKFSYEFLYVCTNIDNRYFMYMAINNLNVLSRVAFETCGYMTKVVFLLKISNKV